MQESFQIYLPIIGLADHASSVVVVACRVKLKNISLQISFCDDLKNGNLMFQHEIKN